MRIDIELNIYEKNGTFLVFCRRTGKLRLVKNYLNNLLHGEYLYFWENGQIRFMGEFSESKRTGKWQNFDHYGSLILEETYSPQVFN